MTQIENHVTLTESLSTLQQCSATPTKSDIYYSFLALFQNCCTLLVVFDVTLYWRHDDSSVKMISSRVKMTLLAKVRKELSGSKRLFRIYSARPYFQLLKTSVSQLAVMLNNRCLINGIEDPSKCHIRASKYKKNSWAILASYPPRWFAHSVLDSVDPKFCLQA